MVISYAYHKANSVAVSKQVTYFEATVAITKVKTQWLLNIDRSVGVRFGSLLYASVPLIGHVHLTVEG